MGSSRLIRLFIFMLVLHCLGCSKTWKKELEEDRLISSFVSNHFTNSKGNTIYINHRGWGVGGDITCTKISSDSNALNEHPLQFNNAIFGISPFDFSFRNDTLFLYFDDPKLYMPKGKFKGFILHYVLSEDIQPDIDKKLLRRISHRFVPDSCFEVYHQVGFFKGDYNFGPDVKYTFPDE